MTNTINNLSVLASLRELVPQRPLRFAEAVRIAELQAERLLASAEITAGPVPSGLITELPRILAVVRPGMPVSGSAHWSNGRWVLCISAGDHPRRRRYSLAHEFHHVVMHPFRDVLFAFEPAGRRPEQFERLADAFAASLLMPKRFVRSVFTSGVQDPYELARQFQVSPAAMRVRLHQLGLFPASPGCGTTWSCRPQSTQTWPRQTRTAS